MERSGFRAKSTMMMSGMHQSKSDLTLIGRTSLGGLHFSGLDELKLGKTRSVLPPESEDLGLTQRGVLFKSPKQASRAELIQGFSLFNNLFPAPAKEKRVTCPPSESFHQVNHIIVGPKGSLSEASSPVSPSSNQTSKPIVHTVKTKFFSSNPPKRRQLGIERPDFILFNWLEGVTSELLHHAHSYPLERMKQQKNIETCRSKRAVRALQPLSPKLKVSAFPGTLPSILGKTTHDLHSPSP